MSPTQTVEDTHTLSPTAPLAPVSTRPSMGLVIRTIRDEAIAAGVSCSRSKADRLLRMLFKAAARVRSSSYQEMYLVSDDEIEDLHILMLAVMPDDVENPPAGTAADLINRFLIRDHEFAVVHTTYRNGRQVRYCAVNVAVHNI
jgi:hypothetical protein